MNFISSLYTPLYNPPTPVIYHTTPISVQPNFYYNTGDISSGFSANSVIDEDDVSRVKLSREDLLKYTSQEYDDHIKRISQKRPLTEKEHKETKKQRRLIKNREYAQISRNKKKSEYTQLSVQIDQLNQQNSELKERVNQLESENKLLKEENRKLLDQMQYSSFSNLYPSSLNSPLPTLDPSPINNSNHNVQQSPPLTPSLSQISPPLTPTTSSEESTSFDIFSEDYSDDLFNSDWTTDFPSSNIPFTFMAVFLCLLLFYPSSMVNQPSLATTTNPSAFVEHHQRSQPVIPSVQQDQVVSLGFSGRQLLTATDQQEPELDKSVVYTDRNYSRHTTGKTFLTMEDVLNDELKIVETAGFVEKVIKDRYSSWEANVTGHHSLPLLICNQSISLQF